MHTHSDVHALHTTGPSAWQNVRVHFHRPKCATHSACTCTACTWHLHMVMCARCTWEVIISMRLAKCMHSMHIYQAHLAHVPGRAFVAYVLSLLPWRPCQGIPACMLNKIAVIMAPMLQDRLGQDHACWHDDLHESLHTSNALVHVGTFAC